MVNKPFFQPHAGGVTAHHACSARMAARRDTLMVAALAIVILIFSFSGSPAILPFTPAIYLPIHTALEVASIAVAAMIFCIGWHSARGSTAQGMLVLSSSFLAVGLLDLAHLLSFPGMPDFVTPSGTSKGIHFWLAARTFCAFGLMAVALLPRAAGHVGRARCAFSLLAVAATVLILWTVLLNQERLPETFIHGHGLTPYKIGFEYGLIAMYALTALILFRNNMRARFPNTSMMVAAAAIMALSELCFTLYADPADVFNVLGHIYKIIAYYYLYWAMFVAGVEEPYRNLRQATEENSRLIALLNATPDFIGLMDDHGRTLYVNRAGRAMVGLGEEIDANRVSLRDCMPDWAINILRERAASDARAEGHWVGETALLDANGGEIPVSQVVVCHRDVTGKPAYWSTICRDISERKKFETVLLDQISHDALTGLPNRIPFNQRLRLEVDLARSESRLLAVFTLGMDQLKKVNDTFGHAYGDELLKAAAGRMRAMTENVGMLARQSGDEFILLMQGLNQPGEFSAAAERLLDCMRKPFYIEGKEAFIGASIGISLFPDDQESADGLLHNAQMALNIAKKEGGDCYRFHTAEMDLRIRERIELESKLHHAVESGQLFLHYQPRVTLNNGSMVGVEALLRWRHPVLGLISPDRFIPVAEESGLIEKIGLWVLECACAQAQQWHVRGGPQLRVSVNLSARQFRQPGLAADVQAVLNSSGLDPSCLELEITESTVMHDTASAIKTLRSLKQLGVTLSIDDFGTGYSSLSYLKLFPIDVLKIDRSFVKDVTVDPNDAAITRAIVALAHSLDLEVVAEGVETRAQAGFLYACGCAEMQGYFFSRPVPADTLVSLAQEIAAQCHAVVPPHDYAALGDKGNRAATGHSRREGA